MSEAAEITIVSNMELNSSNCTDNDDNMSTTNNCSYFWENLNLFGNFYVTIVVTDTYSPNNDSSDNTFFLNTLQDTTNPYINNESINTSLTSGEVSEINAYVNDTFLQSVWVTVNTSANAKTNHTMTLGAVNNYSGVYEVGAIGAYKYKVFANDSSGNENNTRDWFNFTVSKPNASTQNEQIPSTSLPLHIIKVNSELAAVDLIRELNATLNLNTNFTFAPASPTQTQEIYNVSRGGTANVSWYVTTPYNEDTYTLNVTYTDKYNNSWQGSNLQVEVTSSVGSNGTFVDITPYPEVVIGNNFSAQIAIKDGDGNYINPTSLCVSLIDSVNNKIVECNPTTNTAIGRYSTTYTTAAGQNQGQWQVNTTVVRSGTNYYDMEYWYLVGGPFDVRNIVSNDLTVSSLSFSVTTENTGNVAQDLTLVWNVTRIDTGAILDSGADTFAVGATSTRTWTFTPTTTYIGNIRVTCMGYYSGTERAGAFANFVTTAAVPVTPTGGGGGTTGAAIVKKHVPLSDIEILTPIKDLKIDAGKIKTVELAFRNNGLTNLNNIYLEILGINKKLYDINPVNFLTVKPAEIKTFILTFSIPNEEPEEQYSFIYSIKADESSISRDSTLTIFSLRSHIIEKISELKQELINIKFTLSKIKKQNKETSKAETLTELIEEKLSKAEAILDIDLEESSRYVNEAELFLIQTKQELEEAGIKVKDYKELPLRIKFPWVFWVLIALLTILIIALIVIFLIVYKKMNIIKILNTKRSSAPYSTHVATTKFEEELKRLEKELFKEKEL